MQGVKVRAVRHVGKQDVYNMEVESHHNFAVNGGFIVHNCGYALIDWHASTSKEPEKELTGDAKRINDHINSLVRKKKGKRHTLGR